MNTATIALWYYWRWQIECFFKLLKQAGHHLESWQQESAAAIAKRLLVVSMACVKVWAIAADKSKEAAELRVFLIKLSGRQMRHKKEFTNPALLAGLWVFLSRCETIEVEQPVTRLPPHRSRRAELPHRALQNCSLAHGTYLSP